MPSHQLADLALLEPVLTKKYSQLQEYAAPRQTADYRRPQRDRAVQLQLEGEQLQLTTLVVADYAGHWPRP